MGAVTRGGHANAVPAIGTIEAGKRARREKNTVLRHLRRDQAINDIKSK